MADRSLRRCRYFREFLFAALLKHLSFTSYIPRSAHFREFLFAALLKQDSGTIVSDTPAGFPRISIRGFIEACRPPVVPLGVVAEFPRISIRGFIEADDIPMDLEEFLEISANFYSRLY